jgi:hypothetical protein
VEEELKIYVHGCAHLFRQIPQSIDLKSSLNEAFKEIRMKRAVISV